MSLLIGIPLLLIVVIITAYASDSERPFLGFLGFTGFLALLWFMTGMTPAGLLVYGWEGVAVAFGVYVVAGVPWTMVKWWRFARRARARVLEYQRTTPMPKRQDPVEKDSTEQERDPDAAYFQDRPIYFPRSASGLTYAADLCYYYKCAPGPAVYNHKLSKYELNAGDHKPTIITWLALWPFNIVGTLINNVLVRLWDNIYNMFWTTYQRISDRVLSDINVEAPKSE
jgi:hypothetical protein